MQAAPLLLRVSTDALIKVSSCAAPRPWQRAGSVQSRQGLPPCLLFKTPIINSTALSAPPQDLAAGYMSGKLLLKLEAIGFILTHHTAGELRRAGSECRPSFPWALLLTVLLLVPAVRRRRGNKRRQSFKQASRSPLLARCLPPVLLPHTVSPPPAVPPWQFRPFLSRPTATRAAALPHRPSPAPRPPRPPAPRVLPLPVPPRQPAVAHHLLQHPGAPAVHGGHAAQVQELRGAAAAGGLGGGRGGGGGLLPCFVVSVCHFEHLMNGGYAAQVQELRGAAAAGACPCPFFAFLFPFLCYTFPSYLRSVRVQRASWGRCSRRVGRESRSVLLTHALTAALPPGALPCPQVLVGLANASSGGSAAALRGSVPQVRPPPTLPLARAACPGRLACPCAFPCSRPPARVPQLSMQGWAPAPQVLTPRSCPPSPPLHCRRQ